MRERDRARGEQLGERKKQGFRWAGREGERLGEEDIRQEGPTLFLQRVAGGEGFFFLLFAENMERRSCSTNLS